MMSEKYIDPVKRWHRRRNIGLIVISVVVLSFIFVYEYIEVHRIHLEYNTRSEGYAGEGDMPDEEFAEYCTRHGYVVKYPNFTNVTQLTYDEDRDFYLALNRPIEHYAHYMVGEWKSDLSIDYGLTETPDGRLIVTFYGEVYPEGWDGPTEEVNDVFVFDISGKDKGFVPILIHSPSSAESGVSYN